MKKLFVGALFAAGIVWLLLLVFVPRAGQSKIWYLEGRNYLSDYFMPRNTAAHANPYSEPAQVKDYAFRREGFVAEPGFRKLERRDRAYPPGALLPLVPFGETLAGAQACNVVMIGFFLVVLAGCLWSRGTTGARVLPWMTFAALLLSGPLVFAYERGNPIWYSAAGTLVFLLYWDHPKGGVRWLAALGLAIAASIKVMPAVLGVVYLGPIWCAWRERRGTRFCSTLADPMVCAALGVAAFFVPWFFMSGFAAFGDWLQSGHDNVAWYMPATVFGFVPIVRCVSDMSHQAVDLTWAFTTARWLSLLCGAGFLFLAAFRTSLSRYARTLLVTAGMMFVSANMREYSALYLLPALLLWLEEADQWKASRFWLVTEGLLWFVFWQPLQIPFGGMHLYQLENIALLVLCAGAVRRRRKSGAGYGTIDGLDHQSL